MLLVPLERATMSPPEKLTSPRGIAFAILESLPETASYGEICSCLRLDSLIEQGLMDIHQGRTLSPLELRQSLASAEADSRPNEGSSPHRSTTTALGWTYSARGSLRQVYDAMAAERPTTAGRTVESIADRVQALVEFPHLGQLYPFRQGVRTLSHGRFRIPYLLDGERIIILGVFR